MSNFILPPPPACPVPPTEVPGPAIVSPSIAATAIETVRPRRVAS